MSGVSADTLTKRGGETLPSVDYPQISGVSGDPTDTLTERGNRTLPSVDYPQMS